MLCRRCRKPVFEEARKCVHCGVDYPADTFLGRVICGDIQIEKVIGAGGMGIVYKGTKLHLNRAVAIKRLSRNGEVSKAVLETFEREAQVLSRLRHPHIVSVLDSGKDEEGGLFLVLEFIPGQTLEDLIYQSFPLPHERTLRIMVQILSALEEAHSRNVIHRDLKPSNVLLEQVAGQGDFAKVVDFGIAKVLPTPDGDTRPFASNTQVGALVGTPRYMSPEQIQGMAVDQRSDIYSAGLLLYECLTRTVPHHEDDLHNLMRRRVSEEAMSPSLRRPDLHIPPAFDWICRKALTHDTRGRYKSVVEMRREIQAALDELQQAGSGPGSRPRLRRRRASSGSYPTLGSLQSTPDAEPCTVVAISPVVSQDMGMGVQTGAERLFMVWDYLDRFMSRSGGVMFPPNGSTALVLFQDLLGESSLRRAATNALRLRSKLSRHFPFADLKMGLSRGELSVMHTSMSEEPRGPVIKQAKALVRRASAGQLLSVDDHVDALDGTFRTVDIGDGIIDVAEILLVATGIPSSRDKIVLTTSPTLEVAVATPDFDEGSLHNTEHEYEVIPGRPQVQERLDKALGDLQQGRRVPPILLLGPEGAGKTHALGYLRDQATHRGLLVLEGDCAAALQDRPMRPLLDVVLQILSGPNSGLEGAEPTMPSPPREDKGGHITALRFSASRYGIGMTDTEAMVGQWIAGTSDDDQMRRERDAGGISYARLWASTYRMPPQARRFAFVSAMRRLVSKVASPWGAVILLEDLDKADLMTLQAMPGLCSLTSSCPLLIVATAAEVKNEGFHNFERLAFKPLSGHFLTDCWTSMLADAGELRAKIESRTDVETVLAASKGSPLFLSQWITKTLRGGLPESLTEMIFHQLLTLPKAQQRLLVVASALGPVFEVDLLRALLPEDVDHLDRLSFPPSAWIAPCPQNPKLWRFANPSVQRVVFAQLSIDRRRENHRRIHDVLDVLAKTPFRTYLKTVAAKGGSLKSASMSLAAQMGDRFAIAGDPKRGSHWYLIALKALRDTRAVENHDSRTREELILKAALTLIQSDQLSRAEALLEKAHFISAGNQSRADLLLIQNHIEAGDLRAARESGRRALKVTSEIPPMAVALLVLMADATTRAGKGEKAQEFIQRALPVLHRIGHQLPTELEPMRWRAWVIQASIHGRARRFEDAELSLHTALKHARNLKDNEGIFESLRHTATLLSRRKKHKKLLKLCLSLLEDSTLEPSLSHQILLWRVMGQCHIALNAPDEAKNAFQCALQLSEGCGWVSVTRQISRLQSSEHPIRVPNPGSWID